MKSEKPRKPRKPRKSREPKELKGSSDLKESREPAEPLEEEKEASQSKFTMQCKIMLAVSAIIFVLVCVLGSKAVSEFTLKRNLNAAIDSLAVRNSEAALESLNAARASMPKYPYTYDVLMTLLIESDDLQKETTPELVYKDAIKNVPAHTNVRVAYCLGLLRDFYDANPNSTAKSLRKPFDEIYTTLQAELATAALIDSSNPDIKLLQLQLQTDALLLRNKQGKRSKNLLPLLAEYDEFFATESAVLPRRETLMMAYSCYGSLLILKGDSNKSKKRYKTYQKGLKYLRRAFNFRIKSNTLVRNILFTYGRLMADPDVDNERVRKYIKQLKQFMSELKKYYKDKKTYAKFIEIVFHLYSDAGSSRHLKPGSNKMKTYELSEDLFDLALQQSVSNNIYIVTSMKKARLVFSMLILHDKTGEPLRKRSSGGAWTYSELNRKLHRPITKTLDSLGDDDLELTGLSQLVRGLIAEKRYRIGENSAQKLLNYKKGSSRKRAYGYRLAAIFFDNMGLTEQNKDLQQQALQLAIAGYTSYLDLLNEDSATREYYEKKGPQYQMDTIKQRRDVLSGRLNK